MGENGGSRVRNWSAFLLGLILATSGVDGLAAPWTVGAWMTAAGGRESDLTLDASPTPAVVPGGPFVAAIGGVTARTGLPRRTHLDLGAQGWYERFTDADGRTLVSATAVADFTLDLGQGWGLRWGGGAHLFDDTARPTALSRAGWGETGLVWAPRPLRLEIQGGAEGRRYPEYLIPDDAGVPGVYTETQIVLGVHAAVAIGGGASVRAAWHDRRTDARDPAYDARGPTLEAGAEAAFGRGFRVLLDGFYQERDFTERPAEANQDRYRQVGLAVEKNLGAAWQVRATAAVSRYTWPEGSQVDTRRWQLAVTRRFGGSPDRGLPPPGKLPRAPDNAIPRAGTPVVFRLLAPGAGSVALVGGFNGWDPQADPLDRTDGGWWVIRRTLPAGTHAYAYVVDGVWRTPPEAAATEPDGFGGRNGLVVVLP